MRRRSKQSIYRLPMGAAAAALLLVSSLSPAGASPSAPDATSPGAVTIAGNRILRDGRPWVPHAVQLVAFVAPPRAQAGPFLAAYRHYSAAEFAAIRAWGADSVRMQLSQPGADPDKGNPLYDPAFVAQFVAGVKAARAAGLVVFVSIQDEPQSGESGTPATLPNAATRRVWANLAPMLNGDDGIVYEMFNEPQARPNPQSWADWAAAMNAAVRTIRATGAKNTLLADGLNYAETLAGVVPLADPKVAYSSHPYAHVPADETPEAWARKFGRAAATLPVIVGEWAPATTYYCAGSTPAATLAFLKYLEARGIGLVAVTYDFGLPRYGGIMQDYAGTPTSYANGLKCGDVGFGPGRLIQTWYRTGRVPDALE